jgi:hypothetical protein
VNAPSGRHILVAVTVVVVVAAVVTGIAMLGPPSDERARRLDQRRVRELQEIKVAVDAYWAAKGRLPSSPEELSGEAAVVSFPRNDPVTAAPYGYRVVDEKNYELCATFDRAAMRRFPGDSWTHDAGKRCFTRRAGDSPE